MARKPIWTAADQKRDPKRLVIQEKRLAAGLTLEQVGDRIGIGPSQVQRRELNPHMLTLAQLNKLASLFGCTVDELTDPATKPDGPAIVAMRRVAPVYEIKGQGMDTLSQVGEFDPGKNVGLDAYGLVVPDDAMAGGEKQLRRGDTARIDKGAQPSPGDLVHAIDPSTGAHIIRQYAPLHPSNPRAPGFMLRAANPLFDEIYVAAIDADCLQGVVRGKYVDF